MFHFSQQKDAEKKTLKGAVAAAMKPADDTKNMIDDFVILHEAYQFLLKKFVCRSRKLKEGQAEHDEEEGELDEGEAASGSPDHSKENLTEDQQI